MGIRTFKTETTLSPQEAFCRLRKAITDTMKVCVWGGACGLGG